METWMGGPLKREPELRDRVVTLTVGQLTDALAEALKVVSDAGPQWKVGDRAYVEVEVTGNHCSKVGFKLAGLDLNSTFYMSPGLLKEIEE